MWQTSCILLGLECRKSSISPPPPTQTGFFILSPFEGGGGGAYYRDKGAYLRRGSVLHKGLENKVEKLKYKKFRSY